MSAHVIVIKFIPSLLSRGKQKYHPTKKAQQTNKEIQKKQTKQNRTSYNSPHTFMEDTIRHDIAQMRSASKVHISCILVIIIK